MAYKMVLQILYLQRNIEEKCFITKILKFYYQKRKSILEILKKLCERKEVKSRSMRMLRILCLKRVYQVLWDIWKGKSNMI